MKSVTMAVGLAVVLAAAGDCLAQRGPGGRGGGFGRGMMGGPGGPGGGGMSRAALLRIDAVREELALTEDQTKQLDAMRDEMRGDRRGGFGGPGGGPGGPGGERPDFRNMSDEERQQFFADRQKEAAERAKQENEKLAGILTADQSKRLMEVYLQTAGVAALNDPEVSAKLNITDDQRAEMQRVVGESMQGMREEMRSAFESGDREAIAAKMTEMRKAVEEKAVAALTDEQRATLTELKGEAFELPPDALREAFGRGGPGGFGGRRGGPGGGGGGGERPQRGRPQLEDEI